jgi:hypothetical protein
MSPIEKLAARQLAAYNASDLASFVACYHPEVQVFDKGEPVAKGRAAFRSRYEALFANCDFGASVPQRLANDGDCVDLEHWWRVAPDTQTRLEGTVIVHYRIRDGLIGEVHFLRE